LSSCAVIKFVCCREITYYTVKKGVNFTTNLDKPETDLTADMISRSVNDSCELCLYAWLYATYIICTYH